MGVAGAVIHQQRLLLVRHTYGEKQQRWALPGGLANHHERLDESIVCEILEETGLHTEVVDLIGLVTRYTEHEGTVFVVFRLHLLAGKPAPDGLEVDRLEWFTAEEVAAMTAGELWPDIRNPALIALTSEAGLTEDKQYPGRSKTARGFLVSAAGERQW